MLRAGAASVNITPPLGIGMRGYFTPRTAKDIHDDLYAKALVLDDGETKLAIVVCDLIGVERHYLDKAKHLILKRVGIPPSNVLISCTHTHTGPVISDMDYGEFLAQKVADSVQLANNRLREARIGFEREEEPKPLGNRRFWMKDGTVRTNPGVLNPDIVKPAGPIDPEVGVMCVEEPGGKTIALLVNYAMHYAGLSPTEKREDYYMISADYFGIFSKIIQRIKGENFVAILANGACADVIMFDAMKPHKRVNKLFGHAERIAALVAAKALWAWNQMKFHNSVRLASLMEELTIPRRMPTDEEIEMAERLMSGEIPARTMRENALKNFFGPKIKEFLQAPREVRTWVQVLAIGRLAAIVGLPGEIFVELGLKIKENSPFEYTFVVELANDWVGYVPTLEAFRQKGGYETTIGPNKLVPEAGEMMVDAAVRMLKSLYQDAGRD